MAVKRTDRLNSLLREVLSEVITREVKNPKVSSLITVTRVEITSDLYHAKVYVSVMGDEQDKRDTMNALKQARQFITITASKKVTMRRFPELQFLFDDSAEKHMRVEELLHQIEKEREGRLQSKEGAEGEE